MRLRTFFLFTTVSFFTFPCYAAPPKASAPPSCDDEAQSFLAELGKKVVPLQRQVMEASWQFYTTGEIGDLNTLNAKLLVLYGDKENFTKLRRWRTCVRDKELARQVELEYRNFLDSQGPSSLQNRLMVLQNVANKIFIETRPKWNKKSTTDEALRKILRESPDRLERQRAWYALQQAGAQTAGRVKRLVKLRNEIARSLGYRNYHVLRLELNELDEKRLDRLLKKLERLSQKPYENYLHEKTQKLKVSILDPWDISFDPSGALEEMNAYFPKGALMKRLFETYGGMGFDLKAMDIQADLEPREGKSPHAYSFPIDAPKDVRVLVNVADGLGTAKTLFHEYGHSVYSKGIRQKAWDLRAPASSALTEGIGNFFGRIAEDPIWLRREAGVPEALLKRYTHLRRVRALVGVRYTLLLLHFEKAMYENPDRDFTRLWWDLEEKYLGTSRREDTRPWGRVIHFITHPVYLQNYLLADMVCDQLWNYFQTRGGVLGNLKVAPFLEEKIFRYGAGEPWESLFHHAVGARLSPKYYVGYRLKP